MKKKKKTVCMIGFFFSVDVARVLGGGAQTVYCTDDVADDRWRRCEETKEKNVGDATRFW